MTEKSSEKYLKDFIFIDKDRLYSLYSQLFEGVAESMMLSSFVDKEDDKKERNLEQKLIEASFKSKNIVLFDHMYNMLEEKITPFLFKIDSNTVINDVPIDGIIQVKGKVVIDDYEYLGYFFENYNNIGNALAALTLLNSSSDITNNGVERYAKNNNLFLDKKFIDAIVKVINFFHSNNLDLIVHPDNNEKIMCCALLNSKGLRITTNELRNLYGSRPVMKWTVVGQITNISSHYGKEDKYIETNNTSFRAMFDRLDEVDMAFDQVLEQNSDIVKIAPLAVYVEHKRFINNS